MNRIHYIGFAAGVLATAMPGAAHGQAPQPTCQVRVATVPDGAMVLRNGVLMDTAPVTLANITPGTHLLVAKKKGYRDARRTVVVEAGQRIGVEMTLEPITGLLLLHSDPSGADIEINGADRGNTPLFITDLPLGSYRIRARTAGHVAKEVDLDLSDRVPRKLEITMTSNSATLDLKSKPTAATVLLDGIKRGSTPCSLARITAGEVVLEVTMDGYKPFRQTLRLAPGQRETVTATLAPIPASLQVVSIPEGARIYIENQFRGESPVTVEKLEPGTYRIRAELRGYAGMARSVTLRRAQTLVEEFRMARNCGVFEITSEPAGVSVFIDGENVGTTAAEPGAADTISDALRVDLVPIGRHRIQLTKPGYYDRAFPIQVEKDKTVTLHQKMKRRFIPDVEIRTATDVFRGVFVEQDPKGNVRIEVLPGIVKTIKAGDIRSRRPIRTDPED